MVDVYRIFYHSRCAPRTGTRVHVRTIVIARVLSVRACRRQELLVLCESVGISAAGARKIMRKFDRDGDGALDKAEVKALMTRLSGTHISAERNLV